MPSAQATKKRRMLAPLESAPPGDASESSTRLVTDSNASTPSPDKHVLFTQWSRDQGVKINSVKPIALPGRGVGLMTTGKIKKDEQILFVPEKAMCKPNATLMKKDNRLQSASPQAQLALSLMAELMNPESTLHAWQATWPTREDIRAGMPFFWPSHLRELLPASVHQPLDRQIADFSKDDEATAQYRESHGWKSEDFEYFWAIVNSRSFHFKPPGAKPGYMVLCPFIDYMNHGPTGTGVLVSQAPKGYEVRADRDYVLDSNIITAANEELLATYGPHPNDKLLIHYGFLLPSASPPSDDDIRLDHHLLPALPPATQRQLQDVGYLGAYALLPATNGLCFKTQVAVRAVLLTANEWEYFLANGEDLGGNCEAAVRGWMGPVLGRVRKEAVGRLEGLAGLEGGEDGVARGLLATRWAQIRDGVDAFLAVDASQ